MLAGQAETAALMQLKVGIILNFTTMKKLISGLLIVICSLFAMNASAKTSPSKADYQVKNTSTQTSAINAKACWGHYEIVCIYNPVTRMFELHMIWVEDDI